MFLHHHPAPPSRARSPNQIPRPKNSAPKNSSESIRKEIKTECGDHNWFDKTVSRRSQHPTGMIARSNRLRRRESVGNRRKSGSNPPHPSLAPFSTPCQPRAETIPHAHFLSAHPRESCAAPPSNFPVPPFDARSGYVRMKPLEFMLRHESFPPPARTVGHTS